MKRYIKKISIYRKLKILVPFIILCTFLTHCTIAQDTLNTKGLYFQFSNGHASFPKQNILLGDDLMIKTLGLNLSRYYHVELGYFRKLKKVPISIFGGFGYASIQHHVQFVNYRDREDYEQFNYTTFQINSHLPIHQRLTANLNARYYPLKWLFVQGGVSGVVNVFTYKGSDYEREYKAIPGLWDTYAPVFLWPNSVNKLGASANMRLGFEWKGFFVNYFMEKGLTDFRGNTTFRGNYYDLNFGRNDNQGVSLGFMLTLK